MTDMPRIAAATEHSVVHSTFVIERTLDALPERVFRAMSDPEIKRRWFGGPPEWETTERTMDFRVGGRETDIGGPKGGPHSAFRATYLNIVPNERIIFAYDMDIDGVPISVSVTTIELKREGSQTHLTFTEQGAYLDAFDKPEMREHGTREILEQLVKEIDRQVAAGE
jgi:uncharacterized protein YndB with AHSA1/START domain